MAKRTSGKSAGGKHSRGPGHSPRFRANLNVELQKQEKLDREQAAKRKPKMFESVQGAFRSHKVL